MSKQPLIKQDGVIVEALSKCYVQGKAGKRARNIGNHLGENENELYQDPAG